MILKKIVKLADFVFFVIFGLIFFLVHIFTVFYILM